MEKVKIIPKGQNQFPLHVSKYNSHERQEDLSAFCLWNLWQQKLNNMNLKDYFLSLTF